jgi:hypothetical protein
MPTKIELDVPILREQRKLLQFLVEFYIYYAIF